MATASKRKGGTPAKHPPEVWNEIMALALAGRSPTHLARIYSLSRGTIYNRVKSLKEKMSSTKRAYREVFSDNPALALPTPDQFDQGVKLPAIPLDYQPVKQSLAKEQSGQDLATDDDRSSLARIADAATSANEKMLKDHRKRSKALWRIMGNLTKDQDIGAGKSGKAQAFSALTAAHERMVRTDRLIMGMSQGDVQPPPESQLTQQNVLVAVAVCDSTKDWEGLRDQQAKGSDVTITIKPGG